MKPSTEGAIYQVVLISGLSDLHNLEQPVVPRLCHLALLEWIHLH